MRFRNGELSLGKSRTPATIDSEYFNREKFEFFPNREVPKESSSAGCPLLSPDAVVFPVPGYVLARYRHPVFAAACGRQVDDNLRKDQSWKTLCKESLVQVSDDI